MAQDVVINGVTYPAVESVALTDADGNTKTYHADAVHYTEQVLTDEQKAQARSNIGALASAELPEHIDNRMTDLGAVVIDLEGSSSGEANPVNADTLGGYTVKEIIEEVTPVKGVDYWTDADKSEIKAYVDEAILNGSW